MVMTIAKITAGDGYTYLTRHTALGDPGTANRRDATAYYTAQGNPPGQWIGRGAPLLGLAGQEVTEEQMRQLFGYGAPPDADAMIRAYVHEHSRPGMTEKSRDRLVEQALRHATLGRQFPVFRPLDPFGQRVQRRLDAIRAEAGREPIPAETKKVKAEEARRPRAAVAGFDLVFSPVKSAALVWALDERGWVREAIRAAHQDAVRAAFELIEDHAAFTRTGTENVAQLATKGLTGAAFEHWDSRAGDPCLHTHVAISSKVQGVDGKWRALDARALYRITVAASECYNTAFEAGVTARLGILFTPRPDTTGGREPVREIAGVPLEMIRYWSRRRAAIEGSFAELVRAYGDEHGHDPPAATCHKLAQQANLATRQGKRPPVSLAEKRAAWREELTAAFGSGGVARLMSAVPDGPVTPVPAQPMAPVDLDELAARAVVGVAARRSVWTVWNVRAEAERLIRSEVPVLRPGRHKEIAEAITVRAVSPAHSICVEPPALLDEPPELRRADGESVFTGHGAARFTSQAVLDAEQRLGDATGTPTAAGLSGPLATSALDGFEAITGTVLDPGQRTLVTAFAADSRLLLAGIGPAGAGKTTAMKALAHVLDQGGQRLVPLATSAAAADVLGRELGVRAENLHKFLHEWTAGPWAAELRAGALVPEQARMFRLGIGDVVLVDEAGMAGTFQLDQLVTLAAQRGAVIRLLGDDRQLPAVESGGALRLIAAAPGTPHLDVLYRFRDQAEANATLQLRTGDAAAIDWYAANDRVCAGSRESMTQAAYEGWKTDMLARKITLMAAATGADVTRLSAQARADRVTARQVEPDGVRLQDGNQAGAGDWIITRHNDRRLGVLGGRDWVKNGDSWHVEHGHDDGSLTVRGMIHGGRVRLPADYVRSQVQLLYATTAHRAQGATVDTAHSLITEGMTREALYVLATRAREHTVFYVATHDQPFDDDEHVNQARHDPGQYAAREILLNILATEAAPLPATETITVAQQEADSLATLVPRYLHAIRQAAGPRYQRAAIQALGEHAGHALIADPAWDTLIARLYDAENIGWHPAHLLTAATSMRELASADSTAEALAWRIGTILTATTSARPAAGPRQPHAISPAQPGARASSLPPWIPAPPADAEPGAPLTRYLGDAAILITKRITEITEAAICQRPPWLTQLGQPPAGPARRRQWRHQVAVVAAYRDQFNVTSSDPRHILGPYPEPGHPDHAAHRHAAEAVHAARALTSSETGNVQPGAARPASARNVRGAINSSRPAAPRPQPPLLDPRLVPPQPRPGHPGISPTM